MKTISSRFETREFHSGIRIFLFFSITVFIGLLFRLWQLQILEGAYYQKAADENRVRTHRLFAPRGKIYDRFGKLVVDNTAFLNLTVIRSDAGKNLNRTLDEIEKLLELEPGSMQEKVKKARGRPKFEPIRLIRNLSYRQLATISSNRMRLDGIDIESEVVRSYPYNDFAAHLLGYLGEINKKELAEYRANQPQELVEENLGYMQGDLIGKLGIEKQYQDHLAGDNGLERYEAFASGRKKEMLAVLPPRAGNDLFLTLDLDLDLFARELMKGKSGAVIVMDVNTGEVLVLVSTPAYDLNFFTGGISNNDWRSLIEDEMHPLENKTIRGLYPPGSTWKIVPAAAALESGAVTPTEKITCRGELTVGRRPFRCWRAGGHGRVDLHRSIMESCDVYYYTVGLRMGPDVMSKFAHGFGFGEKTGIDLENEKEGIVPTIEWKRLRTKDAWRPGDTVTASIGQGYDLITPIQLVRAYAAIANGGKVLRPFTVSRIENKITKFREDFKSSIIREVPVSEKNLDLIREGLYSVVNGPAGTARRVRLPSITVAGKTGTAQVASQASRQEDESDLPYELRDHAWFAAYAPYEKPEIAITVVVEHGGHGGATAGPIARAVLEKYFALKEIRKLGQASAGTY